MNFKFLVMTGTLMASLGLMACVSSNSIPKEEASRESRGVEIQMVSRFLPTFESIQQNILVPQCLKCHSGPKPAHGVDLSSYESIIQSEIDGEKLVVPGNADASPLYQSIVSGDMPRRAPKLSSEAIDSVAAWINAGAKEKEDATPSESN